MKVIWWYHLNKVIWRYHLKKVIWRYLYVNFDIVRWYQCALVNAKQYCWICSSENLPSPPYQFSYTELGSRHVVFVWREPPQTSSPVIYNLYYTSRADNATYTVPVILLLLFISLFISLFSFICTDVFWEMPCNIIRYYIFAVTSWIVFRFAQVFKVAWNSLNLYFTCSLRPFF